MKNFERICTIFVLSAFVNGYLPVSAHEHSRLDVFHEVLEQLNVTGSVLPEAKVEQFFDGVLHRFSCVENGTALPGFQAETRLRTCPEKLCLNITDIFTLVGASSAQGLAEEQFHEAAMSVLNILSRGKHPCNSTLSPSAGGATVDSLRMSLMANMSAEGLISEDSLEVFLHEMEELYEGIDHGHGDEEDHEHDHRRKKRESNGTGDEHGHEEDDAIAVVEAKCLAPDAVMYYLNSEEETSVNASATIDDVATVIVYLMYEAAAIEEECRMLPKKSEFVNSLIARLTESAGDLSMPGFFQLMERLAIIPMLVEDGHDDHAGHNHMRKRRSVSDDVSMSRVKRQAASGSNLRCYTPPQLMAVFETGDTITPQQLTQMSPALIYQQLFTQCLITANSTDTTMNNNDLRWLYGTITVVIVCLCSLGGVILLPCMNKSIYKLGMALFVGLAVGSLAGDALLHLIPATMGAHQHGAGEEHDHGGEVVVEKYIWFALVTLGGIYLFFLLETLFTRCLLNRNVPGAHGHSHSYNMDELPTKKEDIENPKNKGNMSVSIMIILGDAVHNFADGLAIGAAFSASNSTGIATGIAVFCHELPHELGDFAVLLKNGLTVKQALFWNLMSSLTAILGLYVSLAVATSAEVQIWIFAVAAGMFLYIAMADLFPQILAYENLANNGLFVMNNIGILLGVFIMLIIAIFEERITV
ncbi:zinc transporter ZIP4-like [Littorina saxatilis]|uniref:Zinc transporter ZIP4/12 EF-hand domain-containing protein n=1 Tax=Littorina saxatilis TaxID=31220 RepID=A0AAN9AST4_9CAEN